MAIGDDDIRQQAIYRDDEGQTHLVGVGGRLVTGDGDR